MKRGRIFHLLFFLVSHYYTSMLWSLRCGVHHQNTLLVRCRLCVCSDVSSIYVPHTFTTCIHIVHPWVRRVSLFCDDDICAMRQKQATIASRTEWCQSFIISILQSALRLNIRRAAIHMHVYPSGDCLSKFWHAGFVCTRLVPRPVNKSS